MKSPLLLIFLILLTQQSYCQILRASDIDTTGKSDSDMCNEISLKLDSLYDIYQVRENIVIDYGYIFPEIEESAKEKRKGYLIFKDTFGILPESVKSCDVYVGYRVDPYGRVLCFKFLRFENNKDVITDQDLLEEELEAFIKRKVVGPGFAGSKEEGPIYFPFCTRKIRIQKQHKKK